MIDKIPCKYCGGKYHPRKIKKHELECKNDQKDVATNKSKTFPKGCIIKFCPKCGGETGSLHSMERSAKTAVRTYDPIFEQSHY